MWPAFTKCLEPRRHSLKERRLKRLVINPTPPERVREHGGEGSLTFKDVSISHKTLMLGLPGTCVKQTQPTSTKPRHTRSDPCTDEHGRSKCVLALRPSRHGHHGKRNRASRRSAMSYHALKPNTAKDQPPERALNFSVAARCVFLWRQPLLLY